MWLAILSSAWALRCTNTGYFRDVELSPRTYGGTVEVSSATNDARGVGGGAVMVERHLPCVIGIRVAEASGHQGCPRETSVAT